jgi:alpha-galactosidase
MSPSVNRQEEMRLKDQWVRERLLDAKATPPFSFIYDGRPSDRLPAEWSRKTETRTLDPRRTQHTLVWTDAATGLEVSCAAMEFAGFPAVEWVLHFRNSGAQDTPILKDIQSLAATWAAAAETEAILFRSRGSPCRINDFEYLAEPLGRGAKVSMAAGGGRSSNQWLPFFNLQLGKEGVILAIGWSGQWAAEFARAREGAVALRAGQENTQLRLHPGEEIRTPRMLLLFWRQDRLAAHNTLRRFILEHHTPRPDGRRLVGPFSVAHWGGMKTGEHLERLKVYAREKLAYEYYWMDAGWYGPEDSFSPDEFKGDWWKHVGNWEVNPKAHPRGLRPIADAARNAGMKLLLWVEPERAVNGTPLTREHPEWFLGERKELGNLLFNLGDPAARQWLTDYISELIRKHGVGLYRQDFNFDPLPYWRAADAPDRQGMTEIRYLEGFYAFWDALLDRFPGLVIDNCASGGRRIDLETISRSIPLWRSDWQCRPDNNPIGGQAHGMGLSYWAPLHGTGTWGARPDADADEKLRAYRCRSAMGPAFQFSLFPYEYTPIRDDYPYEWHRRMIAEYRRLRPLFEGDYYPLTDSSASPATWAAYQMHRPDLEAGFVMVFRREEAPYRVADFLLRGLEAEKVYELENLDAGASFQAGGKDLMEKGLMVEIKERPASAVFVYRTAR